jgi:hypothetical protein
MSNVAVVVFSHSDYYDVLSVFNKYFSKYFPLNIKKYLFTNDETPVDGYTSIVYNDSLSYTNKMYSCLEQVKEEIVLYMHEDMILYSHINTELFLQYISVLLNEDIDYIKLLKTGLDTQLPYKLDLNWFEYFSNTSFGVQPSLWKKTKLQDLFFCHKNMTIWQLEESCQQHCTNKYRGLYSYSPSCKKRGMFHWDSHVFPYIATAIVKGKWNVLEYPHEIKKICDETGLDILKRGMVK